MSDYLGNLIARTLSPAVAVRPQLPSLFEPAPATRQAKGEPEFEPQSFVEQPLVKGSSENVASKPSSIIVLGQSVLHAPKQTLPLEASHKSDVPVQSRIFSRAVPSLRDQKQSNSAQCKSDVVNSIPRGVMASAPHEVSARTETQSEESSVTSKAAVGPELRKDELLNRPSIQPVVHSLTQIAPLLPAAATASPPIKVTIGRIEVRAVPPPAQQRAKPKQATVLSLEDYLRQRANGGRR